VPKDIFTTGQWEDYDKELKAFVSYGGIQVGVGVPNTPHPGPRSIASGMTYASIVQINEFGNDRLNIPARPIFTPAMDANGDAYVDEVARTIKKMMKRGGSRAQLASALEDLGDRMVNDVREEQKKQDFPDLKPSTIARKGHDIAWYDEGKVLGAIQGVVELDATFETFSTGVSALRGARGRFTRIG